MNSSTTLWLFISTFALLLTVGCASNKGIDFPLELPLHYESMRQTAIQTGYTIVVDTVTDRNGERLPRTTWVRQQESGLYCHHIILKASEEDSLHLISITWYNQPQLDKSDSSAVVSKRDAKHMIKALDQQFEWAWEAMEAVYGPADDTLSDISLLEPVADRGLMWYLEGGVGTLHSLMDSQGHGTVDLFVTEAK